MNPWYNSTVFQSYGSNTDTDTDVPQPRIHCPHGGEIINFTIDILHLPQDILSLFKAFRVRVELILMNVREDFLIYCECLVVLNSTPYCICIISGNAKELSFGCRNKANVSMRRMFSSTFDMWTSVNRFYQIIQKIKLFSQFQTKINANSFEKLG